MQYINHYKSPIGDILLVADDIGLIGLWFDEQKYFLTHQDYEYIEKESTLFKQTKNWLDIYFSGQKPNFSVPLHFTGTSFQNDVWTILYSIPYGKTTTYGAIAKQLAKNKGIRCMSAQAVGGAISRNKISIIVPCHRIVGINGNLTGYASGINKKIKLLHLEKSYMQSFFLPKKELYSKT